MKWLNGCKSFTVTVLDIFMPKLISSMLVHAYMYIPESQKEHCVDFLLKKKINLGKTPLSLSLSLIDN